MSDGTPEAAASVVLAPAVRALVIDLAAAAVGSMPGHDVPPSLRVVARFTPAKRRRLGADALAATLESDDAFRATVADAARTARPGLADALGEGAVPAAADPAELAALAYLVRPDGWQQTVALASEQVRPAAGATPEAADDIAALRAEIASLRATARGEAARVREAVERAVEDAAEELAALRRTVRDRTRELRAAERERDDALAAAGDARRRAEAATSEHDAGHEAELAELRERVTAAQATADAVRLEARRTVRAERDLDDSRLWLLVDTLVQAAAGVRRELALAPPNSRPGDSVSGGDATFFERRVARAAELDGLLAMPHAHLIVDGYNVTKTGYPQLTLAEQRSRLIGALAALAGRSGAETTVVFDGNAGPAVQPSAPRGVRVLFSAADEIADDVVRRLVSAEPAGRPVLVVTSDQQIVRDTAGDSVWSVPSAVLLERLARGA